MQALKITGIIDLKSWADLIIQKKIVFEFHEAVKQHVLPLVNKIYQKKKEKLGLDTLRPWDIEAEPEGTKPLHPFKTGKNCEIKQLNVLHSFVPSLEIA